MRLNSWGFLFLILLSGPFARAQETSTVTYGDLMIQDQPRELSGPNQAQMAAGYDITNPYLNSYVYSVTWMHEVSAFLDLGWEGSAYSNQRSRYNARLSDQLQVFGVSAAEDRPQATVFAVARLKLLEGRVNLLGLKALPFRLNVKAGSGFLWHENGPRANCGTWGVEPVLFLSRSWGVALRYDQDLESLWSAGQTIYRNREALGLNYVF